MKINDVIYFDHQATTPVHPAVRSAMAAFYDDQFANPHSSEHVMGWTADAAVQQAASKVANLVGAEPTEVIFTSGATESNNMAILGLTRKARSAERRKILISDIEHKCVIAAAIYAEEELGFEVARIPVDEWGRVKLNELARLLDEDVLLVSIMLVNNEIGTIQDIAGISQLVKSKGAYLHCDAAQAPVAIKIDWLAGATDLLSLSGHKMYGPKGVGALVVREEAKPAIEPLFFGGEQQDFLRPGTVPVALVAGMGVAAELLMSPNIDQRRKALAHLRDRFVSSVLLIDPSFTLVGPEPAVDRHPGNANICFTGYSAADLLNSIQPRLAASSGSACTSGTIEPSHVLRAIGLDGYAADSCVRFSLGFDTTESDIVEAAAILNQAIKRAVAV